MNLLEILGNKTHLELALALSTLPLGPEREEMIARAGLRNGAAAGLLRSVAVLEHLRSQAGCAKCDARECLDENVLAEYVDGALSSEELAAVESQLVECAVCLRKAVTLAQLAHELAPVPKWSEVVVGVARRGIRFLSSPFEGFMEQRLEAVPVLAAAAAEPSTRRWRAEVNGITGVFTVTVEDGGHVGLCMGFEAGGKPLSGGRIGLRQDDLLLEVRPVGTGWDQQSFWHLEPGHYTVEIQCGELDGASFPIVIEETE